MLFTLLFGYYWWHENAYEHIMHSTVYRAVPYDRQLTLQHTYSCDIYDVLPYNICVCIVYDWLLYATSGICWWLIARRSINQTSISCFIKYEEIHVKEEEVITELNVMSIFFSLLPNFQSIKKDYKISMGSILYCMAGSFYKTLNFRMEKFHTDWK